MKNKNLPNRITIARIIMSLIIIIILCFPYHRVNVIVPKVNLFDLGVKIDFRYIICGILFVVGDEGVNLKQICDILKVDENEAKRLLLELKQQYESDNHGIRISYLGDAFKLTTKKEHKEYYQKLIENPDSNTLSGPALEILAIVAYNQPITRVEIDEMRGTQSSHMIRKLVAKGLLKTCGKSTMPGRPNLYATTSEFLDYFGLSTIDDLPKIDIKKEEEQEKELFTSIYKET